MPSRAAAFANDARAACSTRFARSAASLASLGFASGGPGLRRRRGFDRGAATPSRAPGVVRAASRRASACAASERLAMAHAAAAAARAARAAASFTSAAVVGFVRVFFASSTRKRQDEASVLASRTVRSASPHARASSTVSRSCAFLIATQSARVSPVTRASYDARARVSASEAARSSAASANRSDAEASTFSSSTSPSSERTKTPSSSRGVPRLPDSRAASPRVMFRASLRSARSSADSAGRARRARAYVTSITSSCLACLARRSSSSRAMARRNSPCARSHSERKAFAEAASASVARWCASMRRRMSSTSAGSSGTSCTRRDDMAPRRDFW